MEKCIECDVSEDASIECRVEWGVCNHVNIYIY